MKKLLCSALALIVTGAFAARADDAAAFHTSGRKIDFTKEIQPILRASCTECHDAKKHKAELRLDNRTDAFKGGDGGKSIVIGHGSESLLIKRMRGEGDEAQMPFKKPPLPNDQINLLARWIDQGAEWPAEADGVVAAAEKHWAYVKPARPVIPTPATAHAKWAINPIDHFIIQRLEKEKLEPSSPAGKETLLRRVSLDLIGLPPTPEERAAFLADESPAAYERVVDRLLASPHYGERWARPWLDLARYADSNGFEKDGLRSMWPWRDWVINALNANMPFDQFTIEQIAGDLLPNPTLSDQIATGFHRNTMINTEGGIDPEEFRYYACVDRVNTTATVWLGSSFTCAQCHNHKYDPFTQKDYYSLLAFFNSTDERAKVTVKLAGETDAHNVGAEKILDGVKPIVHPPKPSSRPATAPAKVLAKALAKTKAATPMNTSLVMRELPATRPTFIHARGAYLSTLDQVQPNTPASLPAMSADWPRTRLGLARWLVSSENPLTARVTVNRLWEQYFGTGLVKTSEDLGTQGELPTHPALLDYLATELIAQHWNLKAMHKQIVMSATYRQSSEVSPSLLERDPANRLLARGPRFRLEGELVRDYALAVSGLLSRKIGGPSVYPQQPEGIWSVVYSGDRWATSTGEDRYRRSLYTFIRRSVPYPMLVTFDAPTREFCCTRRPRTDTPLQALTTLNDPSFVQPAVALARRIIADGGSQPGDQVAYAFSAVLCRAPSDVESNRILALYQQQLKNYHRDPQAAASIIGAKDPNAQELAVWTVVANVLLNLDETLTKG